MWRENRSGWPIRLGPLQVGAGAVTLREVRLGDAADWSRLRVSNLEPLVRYEPTGEGTWEGRHSRASWGPLFRILRREARAGNLVPLVIEVDGRYAGQITIGNIQRGALRSGWIGYWVDQGVGGRGVATAAVAMGVDYAFGPLGLHRLEATVQPDNLASRRVLAKVGFRDEGLIQRYMDVNYDWRDHVLTGLTAEEVTSGAVNLLVKSGRASLAPGAAR